MPKESGPAKEVLRDYLIVAVATGVLCRLPGAWLQQNIIPALLAILFVSISVRRARRDPRGLAHYGSALAGVFDPPAVEKSAVKEVWDLCRRGAPGALRSLLVAIAIAAVIFPLFALGFVWWLEPNQSYAWPGTAEHLLFALSQLFVVALPEEILFRGYIQTRLTDVWPKTHKIAGAHISVPALLIQGIMFALLHVVADPQPQRLAVFFPGLLFGWARGLTGNVGASVWLHTLSNVYSRLLTQGFYP